MINFCCLFFNVLIYKRHLLQFLHLYFFTTTVKQINETEKDASSVALMKLNALMP